MAQTDLFLTHDWGIDEKGRENHKRVAAVNDALKALGYRTWFDSDRMVGDIVQQMSSGIENTKAVVIFLTQRYIEKVNGDNPSDNCKLEFNHAARQKTSNRMVCVVMEERVRNTSTWTGPIGMFLAGKIYIDMSGDLNNKVYFKEKLSLLKKEFQGMNIIANKDNITPASIPLEKLKITPQRTSDIFVGEFECHVYDGTNNKNNWHYVQITSESCGNNYKWQNDAGVSWTLYPKDNNSLLVGEDCPYYQDGYTSAKFTKDGVYGPGNEFYKREGKEDRVRAAKSSGWDTAFKIEFHNKHSRSVCLIWKDYQGNEKPIREEFASGGVTAELTYGTHPFIARDCKTKELLYFTNGTKTDVVLEGLAFGAVKDGRITVKITSEK